MKINAVGIIAVVGVIERLSDIDRSMLFEELRYRWCRKCGGPAKIDGHCCQCQAHNQERT